MKIYELWLNNIERKGMLKPTDKKKIDMLTDSLFIDLLY